MRAVLGRSHVMLSTFSTATSRPNPSCVWLLMRLMPPYITSSLPPVCVCASTQTCICIYIYAYMCGRHSEGQRGPGAVTCLTARTANEIREATRCCDLPDSTHSEPASLSRGTSPLSLAWLVCRIQGSSNRILSSVVALLFNVNSSNCPLHAVYTAYTA